MNAIVTQVRPAKPLAWIIGLAVLMPGAAAAAEALEDAPVVKPIASLWLSSVGPLTITGNADATRAKVQVIKEWQQAKVFDAFVLLQFPPTFADPQGAVERSNALMKEAGGRWISLILPVGKEGWEPSANERLAKKNTRAGTQFDAGRAMTQAQWLELLKDLQSDTWAWVLEQPARLPAPEQAARSAAEFVRLAQAQHKQTVIWLSAQALTRGGAFEKLMEGICQATRADADFIVWMDLPGETLQAGESRWRETMDQLLDKILKLSPPEKTVIQWLNNPKWPTKDVDGTRDYISICQAKAINRFCLLANPQMLEREPWRAFYRTLPKKGAAAAR
jgi:hypothetical protein